ncbi:hypothetical protein WICMUC_003888 [Wickerhamomyces mucosus]|uniref:Endopolyphosphatase n=1 Tax=Wickerhamomyces mucosus TaxID=1378264 RepID=A0A9P8TC41_9ASCO|nr:hypothetical protein WICMUC_003888 [Wickerhamomyces mucosus]
MSSISILNYKDEKKSNKFNIIPLKFKSNFTKFKLIGSLIILLIVIIISYYNKLFNPSNKLILQLINKSSSNYEINQLDIDDIESYLNLGLTPSSIVKIFDKKSRNEKIYHGRFLHITDIHPDEYYKEGSKIDNKCHGRKSSHIDDDDNNFKDNKIKLASKYGDSTLGCDSPMILMDETLKWIEKNLKDKIDFIIWTGDNIRHDNDRKFPRTELEIFKMNEQVAQKFIDIFHKSNDLDPRNFDIPIIPSLGNNDVYPHNLFSPGPTLQTRELWNIWKSFIPQEQLHIFERGAYFFQEVIPNQLAILSINTLYWYKANPLVDSCDQSKDPGYKLFQWLGSVLNELRHRNMKVWLSGHVPPVPKNYDLSCFRKYSIWLHEYRDVIIGGLYGHMNLDHFIPLDSQKAYKSYTQDLINQGLENIDDYLLNSLIDGNEDEDIDLDDYSIEDQYLKLGHDLSDIDTCIVQTSFEANILSGVPSNKENYLNSIRESFYADVKSKKKSGINSERYGLAFITTSVIPTFNPGIRVWEYNISGIEESLNMVSKPWNEFFQQLDLEIKKQDLEEEEEELDLDSDLKGEFLKKKKKHKKDKSLPPKMPSNAKLGPAYTPQLFSPLKYVQYYLDLEKINKGEKKFGYEIEYKSTDKPYNLKSLLVDDLIDLSRDFGKPIKKKKQKNNKKLDELWETYKKHAVVSAKF